LTYGLRGLAYFAVTVQGCEQDLHSGVLGGTVHEAMTDLMQLMASLIDSKGNILIDGIMDDVAPMTQDEEALYESIDFDLVNYKEENRILAKTLMQDNEKSCLMHRWRYPTVSLHGVEGAFHGSGAKTVIPAKVTGKFSMRLVPNQDPERIEKLVTAHLENKFAEVRWIDPFCVSLIDLVLHRLDPQMFSRSKCSMAQNLGYHRFIIQTTKQLRQPLRLSLG
jgi:cytosolic nonspecific dipeptidase